MATLYEIDKQIEELLAQNLINEDGEITDEELFEKFEELQEDRYEKIENIGLYIKNLTAENIGIDNEIKAFKNRKETNLKTIERLEELARRGLAGQKFSTPKVAISFRKSTSTVITDEGLIPEVYKKTETKTIEKIDKASIKKALADGEVPGAHLEEKLNVKVV